MTTSAGRLPKQFIRDAGGSVMLDQLTAAGTIAAPPGALRGRSVLVSSDRQMPALLALLQLDGVARRILLCPADLGPAYLPALIAEAQIDTIVSDGTGVAARPPPDIPLFACGSAPGAGLHAPRCDHNQNGEATEWLLFTSGTTGRPKVVVHTLTSLIGPLDDGLGVTPDAVWSTFYDIRRYGGLTIMLRALLGGGTLVLSEAGEAVADFLLRAGRCGVTHLSGTPSHWRQALMSEATGLLSPGYVRLSGEVADQAILNSLAATFPAAEIAHAFASTEAGFAFDVRDRLAGFPAAVIGEGSGGVALRVESGSLRIRSSRAASRYLGDGGPLADAEGFIDTGDMLELRGDRYHFVGRRSGVINVGGRKIHPEEIEAIINQHPDVQMSWVHGRHSPITGALVVAEIVVRASARGSFQTLRQDILEACRQALPPYKIPAMLGQVTALELAASGKLARLLA